MPDRPEQPERPRIDRAQIVPDGTKDPVEAALEAAPSLHVPTEDPAEDNEPATSARPHQRPRRRWRWMAIVAPTMAIVAGLLIGFIAVLDRPDTPGGDHEMHPGGASHVDFRGTVALKILIRRGSARAFELEGDGELRSGDSLSFVVTSASAGFIDLFSIDGKHAISAIHPKKSATARATPLALIRRGRHQLPGSVKLDDSPGPERLVLVFSRTSFDRKRVERAIRARLLAGKKLSAPKLSLYSGVVQLRVLNKRRR